MSFGLGRCDAELFILDSSSCTALNLVILSLGLNRQNSADILNGNILPVLECHGRYYILQGSWSTG